MAAALIFGVYAIPYVAFPLWVVNLGFCGGQAP
jgi:hypothetical protein